MRKTLLLCFIHGFKGGDDTFRNFPSHLKAILQHALPNVNVLAITYPKYETRGDLKECVGRFKEWLQNKVIDLEVSNGTPSPTVEPSVHTILVGHSMGGIVAAEALLSIVHDQPIQTSRSRSSSSLPEPGALMFPYIHGILAFDTPYLGIAPGVVAHGAEKHWNTANSAFAAYNNLAGAFGWNSPKSPASTTTTDTSRMIPAPESSPKRKRDDTTDAAAAPLWQRYGKVALFAGAAGAVAAGGAAAYLKRDQISSGVTWATSHLEFVGVLARPKEMEARLNNLVDLSSRLSLGFANMYTALGHAIDSDTSKTSWTGRVAGIDRTFCNVPKGTLRAYFTPTVNDKATAETWAHMSMFEPKNNPGYYGMSEGAKETIVEWVEESKWYLDSDGPTGMWAPVEEEAEMVDVEEGEEEFEEVKREEEKRESFVEVKREL
ncbi:hypothetical protein M011DRAFT_441317 [Sporormia fimetaria CBS 119925]|uniref:AB hydrolase-1 domain-containing protein n=1 Tax=Sporormia fimetaria CBS 119925 TaxID=1340428 RepID=A0A6A6VI84_9PLEO|nr:hypothetical protein M011DRAFT_441317 [Sporormia fimetaria CBS 119925]